MIVVLLQTRLRGRSGDLLAITAPGHQSRAKSLSNQQPEEEIRKTTIVNKCMNSYITLTPRATLRIKCFVSDAARKG